jgi:hypothetical protein
MGQNPGWKGFVYSIFFDPEGGLLLTSYLHDTLKRVTLMYTTHRMTGSMPGKAQSTSIGVASLVAIFWLEHKGSRIHSYY